MKTSRSPVALSHLVCLSVLFVGCAAPDAPEQNAQAVNAAQPTPDLGGTWRFDLEASEVAAAVRQDCSAKADAAACWSEIAAEAKLEKIRFVPLRDGHSQWSSFAVAPHGSAEQEVLFLTVPVELTTDGPNRVLAKVAGEAKGKQAPQFAKANIHQLRIDVIDAKTIALLDPKKGRLVYSKE